MSEHPHRTRPWLIPIATIAAAAISGASGFLVARLDQEGRASRLEAQVHRLTDDRRRLERDVQRLETEIAPFRALAQQRHPGPDDSSLQELADEISSLAERLGERGARVESGRSELESLRAQLASRDEEVKQLRAESDTPSGLRPRPKESLSAAQRTSGTASVQARGISFSLTKLQVLRNNEVLVRASISNLRSKHVLLALGLNRLHYRNSLGRYLTFVVDNLGNRYRLREVAGISALRKGDRATKLAPGERLDASFTLHANYPKKIGTTFEFSSQLAVLKEDSLGEAELDVHGFLVPRESVLILVSDLAPATP